jgi:cellulose synthase/poly-beta-1,6-N-acetylglucosamine synthase-like glycosyltransferase
MKDAMLPFVSFVIPARNEEENIEKCIKAISDLEYPKDRYEIIVADGDSEDETRAIAERLGARVIVNKKVIQSAARNIGATNAKGELVAFTDADIILDRAWLKTAVAHFKDPKVSAVGSLPGIDDEAGWIEKVWFFHLKSRHPGKSPVSVSWLASANLLYVKEIFDKIGGFNESIRYTEDVDIGFRTINKGYKLIFDPNLKSVHLDYEKTLAGFIKRQLAGGRAIINLLSAYGLKKVWRITLFIGIYAVCLLTCFIGLFFNPVLSLLSLMLMIFIAVLIAVKCSLNEKTFQYFLPLTFLIFLSGIMRAVALVLPDKKQEYSKN